MDTFDDHPERRASGITVPPAPALPPRVFEVDGGHVVLDTAADAKSADPLRTILRNRDSEYVTLLVDAAPEALERTRAVLASAAGLFDRLVVCAENGPQSDADAAALEAGVRANGLADCRRMADPCRALRHCVDAMLPGDVVVYCCAAQACALEILEEFGAVHAPESLQARAGSAASTAASAAPGSTN